jgi:hypothetical protein
MIPLSFKLHLRKGLGWRNNTTGVEELLHLELHLNGESGLEEQKERKAS